jgi:pimeloyl-ACP methyl ester carboxylesterase
MMTQRTKGGIAYEERGSGFPFIALHGFSLDRRMSIGAFEPLFDRAGRAAGEGSRSYRRIYPDLPFMGESTDAPGGSAHDGVLAAMAAFIEEVAPGGPFLVAGESYGGYIARGLARELGDRVRGLFLLCPMVTARAADRDASEPAVLGEEAGWRERARAAGATPEDIADYEKHAVVRSLDAFLRTRAEVLAGIRIARYAVLERYYAGKEGYSFDALGRADPSREPDAGAFDPVFDRPACFFLGRQDISVGWRDALRLAPRYPRASYHVLDRAGHNAQIEHPAEFTAAFRAWIGDCESAMA